MSAAQTDIAVEQAHEKAHGGIDTPRHRALPGSSLDEILTASNKPLIAVDLDDVLSQTNRAVIECEWLTSLLPYIFCLHPLGHNDAYGTQLTLSSIYCTSSS